MFAKNWVVALSAVSVVGLASAADQAYPEDQSFTYPNLPYTWRSAQTGYNNCTTSTDPATLAASLCQTLWVNSIEDFCVWAPPTVGAIGDTETEEIAWCLSDTHGARVIPNGTFTGVHWVKTPNYTQLTGVGDFTKLNIPSGDYGGELDPYGATLQGNPIGGLVYSNSLFTNGTSQVHLWTLFISDTEFCMRICGGDRPTAYCDHLYDERGCAWNMPGNYAPGSFDVCLGDSTEPPGVYTVNGQESTYYQPTSGATQTLSVPTPHPEGATSACTTVSSLVNNAAIVIGASSSSSMMASSSAAMSSSSASTMAMTSATSSPTAVMSVSSGTPAVAGGSGTSSTKAASSASGSASSAANVSTSFDFGFNLVTMTIMLGAMSLGMLALL